MPISDEKAFDYVAAVYAASDAYAFETRADELAIAIAKLEREDPAHRLVIALQLKLERAGMIAELLATPDLVFDNRDVSAAPTE